MHLGDNSFKSLHPKFGKIVFSPCICTFFVPSSASPRMTLKNLVSRKSHEKSELPMAFDQ